MEKLYKLYEELVTKLKTNFFSDEFSVARIKLTFFYTVITSFIIIGFSISLYFLLLNNIQDTLGDQAYGVESKMADEIFNHAKDSLENKIIIADGIILILVLLASFFLTSRTLKPIKENSIKQKRFVADASHEMRTPTSIVISGIEVALRNKNLNFDLAKETLIKTLNEMREFSILSNTLLDLSKYDMQKTVNKEDLNISNIVDEVVNRLQNLAALKNINLNFSKNLNTKILGNKMELERVLYNILNNAITHTKAEGKIEITENILKNKYILEIQDTGAGISKEIISKIFDPFFRGNTSRNTSGAGLGLTLVKKIIAKHNGNIKIESEVGVGTEVIITLPLH